MASSLPLTSKPSIKSRSNIPRIILLSVSTITIFLCSFKLFTAFLISPQTPTIHLNNLLVPSFKVSNSDLAAIWLANITIYNPNTYMAVQMKQIEASILYKHDDAVSLTSVDDFELGFQERKDVYVQFLNTDNEVDHQPIVEYPLLREIEEDMKRRGKVRFRMRLDAMTKYGIELLGWRTRPEVMNSYSVDLDVSVGDERGIGDSAMDGSLLMMVTD